MKVTILIPNYNNEAYLVECLNSIKKQTYSDFEVLIIDDKSTDKSVGIINNYQGLNITLIQKEKNSGIIDTLNIGLEKIKTEYIIRMDADDIMHPQRVEKLINFMDNNDKIGVCGSGIQQFGISNKAIVYESDQKKNYTNLIYRHTIGHASIIIRTNILKSNNITYTNGYKYIEDYKLFYDLSFVTKMTSIPDLLYLYRREEYNNFKNIEIKKIGYLKIYAQVLSSFRMNSKKNTEIHYEIFHQRELTFNYHTYISHLNMLIEKNKQERVYDFNLLENIILEYKNKIYYRCIDQKKIKFKSIFFNTIKSRTKLFYTLKKTING